MDGKINEKERWDNDRLIKKYIDDKRKDRWIKGKIDG